MPLCRCILLKFYIKPQLRLERELAYCVVSYRNSTSNHNYGEGIYFHVKLYLIEILHQTTTAGSAGRTRKRLYLIEILHQTTTTIALPLRTAELYLIEILHQTTTEYSFRSAAMRLYLIEILHQTTTLGEELLLTPQLYLIEILHQTTTSGDGLGSTQSCILSKFYIKPQPYDEVLGQISVVSYRNSTSNHNFVGNVRIFVVVVSYRNSTSNHNVGPHID